MIPRKTLGLLLGGILLASSAHPDEPGFTTIFNGRDLTGWDAMPGAWKVSEGAIVSVGDKSGHRNWIIWRGGVLEDFELRLKFKYIAGNSGVQVRSYEMEGWQVRGYQVEVAAQDKMGLWHHSLAPMKHRSHLSTAGQRNSIANDGTKQVVQFASPETVQAAFREGEWNEMTLIGRGPTLIQSVNGVVLAELTDEERALSRRSGLLAFQDHGKGTLAAFKDIRIKHLRPTPQVKKNKPNVLFIVSDDLNTDLSCYGHGLVQSPNIDRIADRGVRFQRAYCQYPVCNPSRSSFMTGLYPDQTGVLSNGGDFRKKHPDLVTLPQMFQKAGYHVARVGKIYHYGVPTQIGTPGEDDAASWHETVNPKGIDKEVEDQIHSLVPGSFGGTLSWLKVPSTDAQHTDGVGATEAIRLLEKNHPSKTGKPFFLAMGFYRPHTPYVAPPHYFDLYPQDKIVPVMEKPGDRDDIPPAALNDRKFQRELTVERRKEIIQAYYASVTLMDAQVGRLLDELDRLKLRDDTIIVFLSDHGYHLGAHGLWQKSDLFEGSTHVPLIIADPRKKTAGRSAQSPAELVDLYPTLAELCGLKAPGHVQGISLAAALSNPDKATRRHALSVTVSRAYQTNKELPRKEQIMGYTLRTDRHRYTEWNAGDFGAELYDYQTDPEEFTNLALSAEHERLVKQMRDALHTRVKAAQ
jgi:iduronate 2-sulfatase